MSLFGSLDTAVSGLTAQSAAFSNISDNVANSQTVGFKETNTAFQDFLTSSSASDNQSGDVVALPEYQNTIQGTIAQSQGAVNLAISGQGMFQVSIPQVTSTGANTAPVFSPLPGYTRAGDFTVNAQGYLVNSANSYLNGWAYTTAGTVNKTSLAPIQITPTTDSPVATSTVTLSANLPATPALSGSSAPPYTTQATVYDSNGTAHQINLVWTQTTPSSGTTAGTPNDWTVTISSPDDTTTGTSGSNSALGVADVQFGSASGNAVSSGTIGNVSTTSGAVTTSTYVAGGAAQLNITTTFPGLPAQTIAVNLGTYGGSAGVTQFAGTTYTQNSLTQDGSAPGQFNSVSTTTSGDIVVNYSNGQSKPIARVPIAVFNDADALQRQNGQVFTTTINSGAASIQQAGTEGAGTIDINSVEESNVDIASEFSKLIVAQQSYSANTKIVTTANTLLQQTLDMKQ